MLNVLMFISGKNFVVKLCMFDMYSMMMVLISVMINVGMLIII